MPTQANADERQLCRTAGIYTPVPTTCVPLLADMCRSAQEQLQQLSDGKSAAEAEREQLATEKEQLLPQLEQARWQNRQLEKKLEEAAAGRSNAEQVCVSRGGGVLNN